MMSIEPSQIILWAIIFIAIGALWYVIDRRIGVRLYRWWHDLTHEKPLPPEMHCGFVYNQRARVRLTTATIVAIVQSLLAIVGGAANPFVELFTLVLEVPLLMVGFYFGPFLYRLWEKKDHILDTVDRLESGELDIKGEIREASQKAAHLVRDALTPDTIESEATALETKTSEKQIRVALPTPPATEEPQDPASLMKQYLRRK